MITKEEWYIASVKCYQVKGVDGKVLTKEDVEVWLSEERDYPTLSTNKQWAHKFKKIPNKEILNHYDGMPWYYRIKPGTIKVIKVTKESYVKIQEELVK